jgi:hypothetical protein
MCHPQAQNNRTEEPRAALRFALRRRDDGNYVRHETVLQQAWSIKDYVPEQLPQIGKWEEWVEWRDVPKVPEEVVDAENHAIAARLERHRAGAALKDVTRGSAGAGEPVPVGDGADNGVLPTER